MNKEQLLFEVERLENFERMAGQTVSPFAKAALAEKAVGALVSIIKELVHREVMRGE